MRQYLTEPWFWVSVAVVALVLNFLYQKFLGGKGQLV